jgi:hypothetical protein
MQSKNFVADGDVLAGPARKNILTRRANHRHIFIVARTEPAPEKIRRGLFDSDNTLSGHTLPSAPTWPPQRTELADSQGRPR